MKLSKENNISKEDVSPSQIEQAISQKNVEGNAVAENFHIDKVEKLTIINNYGQISEHLETKNYEDTDMKGWENEDLIISASDMYMLKSLIENEKELVEVLPLISPIKKVFNLLPKKHKGLLVKAYQIVLKENKIRKKLEKSKEPDEEPTDEMLKLMDELSDEEELSSIYNRDYYDDFKKIYNLIRCGDLEDSILPFVVSLESKHKDNHDSLKEEFLIYWSKRLSIHPYAVFVSKQNSRELIVSIFNKFENKEKKDIKIFARREESIIMARLVCEKIERDTGRKYTINNYNIGYDKAITFIFPFSP